MAVVEYAEPRSDINHWIQISRGTRPNRARFEISCGYKWIFNIVLGLAILSPFFLQLLLELRTFVKISHVYTEASYQFPD